LRPGCEHAARPLPLAGHPFVSGCTPYYFSGTRTKVFLQQNTKLERWLVNGWQTFGQWHETRGLATTVDFMPSPWILFRLEYSHRWSNHSLLQRPGGHHRTWRRRSGDSGSRRFVHA
jgi:hypothetical protein